MSQKRRLLSTVDAVPPSVAEKNELQLVTFGNGVTSAMLTVALVLVCVLLVRTPPAPLPAPCPSTGVLALVADNGTCGMTSNCQQGFVSSNDASCIVLPRPTNTSCQWVCAPSEEPLGTCNGLGECVGNLSLCPGTCDSGSDCPLSFYNLDIFNEYDPETFWTFSSWYNPKGCYWGTCTYAVLDIYVVSSEFPLFVDDNQTKGWWPGASRYQCLDYVNSTLLAERRGCIEYERFLLSQDMVFYEGEASTYDSYANGTFPLQVSLCVMRWSCSEPNAFGLESAASLEVPVKTLTQRGFTPIASSGGTPLGIADPRMRNVMMATIEEKTREQLPLFLAHVFGHNTPTPVS